MAHNNNNLMGKITALCKRRGFIFPGSEIYGGLAGTWDYGPLGVLFKNNIKKEWWRSIVELREDVVGIDAAILMNPKVWEASGHVEAFADPLIECKICHERFRQDAKEDISEHEKMHEGKDEKKPEWTEPRQFNLLVKAFLGVVEEEKRTVYLRGEITQGVYANFRNVLDSTQMKIPFGIAQIGKAFRNEITPGNFTFRSREFEQMELQFFIKPEEKESEQWYDYWKEERLKWYADLGMKKENLRFRDHEPSEKAHYARFATDVEYLTPAWGWKEFEGIHHRGEWDLKRHSEFSGKDLSYYDEESGKRFIPWVIETSGGVDRTALFFLIDAYFEDAMGSEQRVVLRFHPKLAPIKVGVFPLLANKPKLVEKARSIYNALKPNFVCAWDDRGNIGKRYYSQDEIGTPWCVTVDFETLENGTVTVRDRDTAQQERIRVDGLKNYFEDKLR